jgi:hypothetical protein
MNTKTRLFTGTLALALAATSALFTASDVSARPRDYDDDYYRDRQGEVYRQGDIWHKRESDDWHRGRDVRYRDRDVRYSDRDFNDRDYYRVKRRKVYVNEPYRRNRYYPSNSIVRLPDGCRRVVYRDRTYYTRDNNQYYTYDSDRRGFIVVDFPGVRLGF